MNKRTPKRKRIKPIFGRKYIDHNGLPFSIERVSGRRNTNPHYQHIRVVYFKIDRSALTVNENTREITNYRGHLTVVNVYEVDLCMASLGWFDRDIGLFIDLPRSESDE